MLIETEKPNLQFVTRASTRPLQAYRVEWIADESGFDALCGEWDQLVEASDQSAYFLRWHWNRLWWETYAPVHSRLQLLTCRNQNGELVGLAPFYWRQRYLGVLPYLKEILFLGTGNGPQTSEYLNVITRRGDEQAVVETFADHLLQRDDWHRLGLWGMPADSVLVPYLQRALSAQIESRDNAPYIDASVSWEQIKQQMGKTLRSNIDRYVRRLFRERVCHFYQVETITELHETTNALVRLHQARWQTKGETGSFMLPGVEHFLRSTIQQSFAEGRLRLWGLRVEGQIVATLLAFVDNGIVSYFQSGFDPAYASYRLGTVMLALCIQSCVADPQIQAFDFMSGGKGGYKDHWTKCERKLIELQVFRRSFLSTLHITLVQAKRKLSVLRQF